MDVSISNDHFQCMYCYLLSYGGGVFFLLYRSLKSYPSGMLMSTIFASQNYFQKKFRMPLIRGLLERLEIDFYLSVKLLHILRADYHAPQLNNIAKFHESFAILFLH